MSADKIVYVKPTKQAKVVGKPEVRVKDLAQLEGDQEVVRRLLPVVVMRLKGGEAQKVAIARVFAADYPIVIMDEPSSALDPMAEYQLNQSILHHTQDKTVVFISHRLSTTRIADTIYMFDTGTLVEQGSHEELLERDGKYAEMFRLQSEKYEESGRDGE